MPSYEKRNGKWSVRFRYVDGSHMEVNKRLSGFDKRYEAEEAYRDFLAQNPQNVKVQETIKTFPELLNAYLRNLKANVKESSYVSISRAIETHISPYFANRAIKDIKPLIVSQWQNQLSENAANYSHKYKTTLRGYLHNIFAYAKLYGYDNPVKSVNGFKNLEGKKEMLFWTEQEFETFYKAIDDLKYRAVFAFLYLTGTRKGEALGLKWEDIDFENKLVKISKTLTKDTLDGNYKLTSPKSKNSSRIIILPNKLVELLAEYKKEIAPKNSDFLFGKGEDPLPFQTLLNRFNQYIKKAEVKKIRIHDLRHSHVSLLINKGENDLSTIYIIAERIGDNVEQIYKTYGHLFPNKQSDLVKKLDIEL